MKAKGSKYEATKHLPLKDCLKLIRKDIKAHIRSPDCVVQGAELKTCKMTSRSAVSIALKLPTVAFDFSQEIQQTYRGMEFKGPNFYKPYSQETRAEALCRTVKAIADEYNYDTSDASYDIFDYHFLTFVSVIRDESTTFVRSVFQDMCAELGFDPSKSFDTWPHQVAEFLEMHAGGFVDVPTYNYAADGFNSAEIETILGHALA